MVSRKKTGHSGFRIGRTKITAAAISAGIAAVALLFGSGGILSHSSSPSVQPVVNVTNVVNGIDRSTLLTKETRDAMASRRAEPADTLSIEGRSSARSDLSAVADDRGAVDFDGSLPLIVRPKRAVALVAGQHVRLRAGESQVLEIKTNATTSFRLRAGCLTLYRYGRVYLKDGQPFIVFANEAFPIFTGKRHEFSVKAEQDLDMEVEYVALGDQTRASSERTRKG